MTTITQDATQGFVIEGWCLTGAMDQAPATAPQRRLIPPIRERRQ
jgi:hypothetical protein